MTVIAKKICLVGDFGVGKTSLIRRFVDQQFSDQYLSTVGVKISRKLVEFPEQPELQSKSAQLLIWDIEGSTKFKGIAPNYLQGAKGAIVVADLSRRETIEHLEEHFQLFLTVNPQGLVIMALNKSDLVPPSQAEEFLKSANFATHPQFLGVYATSAKMGDRVDDIFQTLASQMLIQGS